MNANALSRLHAATASVAADVAAQTMSASGRFRLQMSAPNDHKSKTKPISRPVAPAHRPLASRQLMALAMLLSGKTTRAVSRELHVSDRTLRRWKLDPRFVGERDRRIAQVLPATLVAPPPRAHPVRAPDSDFDMDIDDDDPGMKPLTAKDYREMDELIGKYLPKMSASVRKCPPQAVHLAKQSQIPGRLRPP